MGEISFRDRLYTIGEGGRRKWVFASLPKGHYTQMRHAVALLLISLFMILPHVKYQGEPFLLLNVLQRKFILFGMVIWPQDTYMLGVGMLAFVVGIILFTVVYGRIWCGWACPQTIFMEIIFRRIETWIDGPPSKQRELKERSMDWDKFWRRSLKFFIFLGIIFYSVNNFSVFFIGKQYLYEAYQSGFAGHPYLLAFIIVFTFAGMFIYWWFREQTCSVICPYGRLQGVLLDNHSLIVAYDYKRGEPRGKTLPIEKRKQEGLGDCIDCKSCVRVCPTGIDIRNGTQLECVNCTACIDACDSVMDRIGLPRGLIRITSELSIREGKPHRLNWRAYAYSVVLILLLGFFLYLMLSRSPVEATVLRTPGTIFQPYDSSHISNLYNLRIVNKTRQNQVIRLKELNTGGMVVISGGADSIFVKKESSIETLFFLVLPKSEAQFDKKELVFRFFIGNRPVHDFKSTFVGTRQNPGL
ncbi:MAG: cytochrome c oxidase accessory protein CcoG [Bacteroidales bacterium]